MAVSYEWIFYTVDDNGDREIAYDSDKLEHIIDDSDELDQFEIVLNRYSDQTMEQSSLYLDVTTNHYELEREFDCGTKVPIRFHKEVANLQNLLFDLSRHKTNTMPKKLTNGSESFVKEVNDSVGSCIHYLSNGRLSVRRPAAFNKRFLVSIKNTRRCWGGVDRKGSPRITISSRYAKATGLYREYPSIAHMKGIGNFVSEDVTDHIRAMVAHEMAHAADLWNKDSTAPHGASWRHLYRKLREHLNVPEK